ncbi:MAG: glycosyltransferase family 39 protein [bacterium]
MSRKVLLTGLAVFVVVLVAIGFRFYDITNYPPGLFPDEAANGEDALLILEGDYRPFYPRGNGREALFFFLEALSIKLFGIGAWQLHMVSAVIGALTVVATYFATRIWFGRLAGVLAALFLATSHWHVTLSRTGFRAILIPLFLAAFTALTGYVIAAIGRKKAGWSYVYAALAGAALAGGFYTYIAYRVMVGVVGGIFVLLLLAAVHPKIGFPHFRRYGRQLAVGAVAAVLVLAPLGWYFGQNPEDFVGRAGQVSVFSKDLQEQVGGGKLLPTLAYTAETTLMSFFAGPGDVNWRHNVAGFALLNPLVGLLFLLGLAWTIHGTVLVAYKVMRGQEVHLGMIFPYLLLLLLGMLMPVITTAQGLPHGLRSIGLAFPIFLLAGTAGAVIVHWCRRRAGSEAGSGLCGGLIAGLLLLGVVYDGALYFGVARNDPGAHYAYRGDLTQVAVWLNEYAGRPYLVLDKFSLQTIHFLTSVAAHEHTVGDEVHPDEEQHKWRQVDPAMSHLTVLKPGEVIAFTQSTLVDADRYEEIHPEVELIESKVDRFGQEIMRVYEVPEPAVEGIQNEGGERGDLDA